MNKDLQEVIKTYATAGHMGVSEHLLKKGKKNTLLYNKVQYGDALECLRSIRSEHMFDVCIADPPYNIGKNFGNCKDNMPLKVYVNWSLQWIREILRLLKPTAPLYVYGFPEVMTHIAIHFPVEQQRWLVWHYTNKTVPSSRFWQRSHESILCLWKGARPQLRVDKIREPYTETYKKLNGQARKDMNCRYGRKGKHTLYSVHPQGALPRDVLKQSALAGGAGSVERWFFCKNCAAVYPPKDLRQHENHKVIKHPTQKPLLLTKRLLLSAATKGSKVLIPFAGSGSECVACKALCMDFLATEINKDYVTLANKLLKVYTRELFKI